MQTRASATEITDRLTAEGHQVACLTGEYEGNQRDVIIDAFRDGKAKVLIATNVLARGIDVQTVSLVINYVCSRPKTLRAHLRVLIHDRIFRSTCTETLTLRRICTVSGVLDDLDVLVCRSV